MESKDHFDRCSDCKHDLNFARTSPTGLLESEDGRDALEVTVQSRVTLDTRLGKGGIKGRVLVLAWDKGVPFL